jgi:hypothetical protein
MMERLIRTYLLQKSSVSIPGLGTIYVERSPAHSDFINRQVLPPSYHFRFDKYFDAPGKDFFTFLAARKNIEDYEAIKLYNEWAHSLRNDLSTDQSSSLEGIGVLKRGESGDVIFEAEPLPDLLNIPVPAERIIRTNAKHTMLVGDKEVSNVEMTEYLHDEVHKEKTSWWIYALIIAAVALTAIMFHLFRKPNVSPFGNHQTIQTK